MAGVAADLARQWLTIGIQQVSSSVYRIRILLESPISIDRIEELEMQARLPKLCGHIFTSIERCRQTDYGYLHNPVIVSPSNSQTATP